MRKLVSGLTVLLLGLLLADAAWAHWCNNIFTAPARMVVKPEKPTVFLSGGQAAKLRVYVRNNFPHRLFNLQMRGAATGYTITVSPSYHDAYPSQNVSFLLTITPTSGPTGNVNVTTLNLQVRFRQSPPYGWQSSTDCRVLENPPVSLLTARSVWNAPGSSNNCGNNQSSSLTAATLADLHPTTTLAAGSPTFGRTGMQQLINYFGYRFCYSATGGWRSSGNDCPSPTAEGSPWTSIEQFGQNCLRAGVEIAVRKAQLGSGLTAARNAAVNAMKAGSGEHKCLAAVVGAYLWQGASSTASFTGALSTVSQNCQNAAHRILGGGTALSCGSGWPYYERAACAAAEGLRNNNGPVTSILLPNAGDGYDPPSATGYDGHYYAYMLRIVASYRQATGGGTVPFYPDAGGPTADNSVVTPPDTGTPPPKDTGVTPPKDTGVTPPKDTGVTPPKDTGVTPPKDTGVTPPKDTGVTPPRDTGVKPNDGPVTPPTDGPKADGPVTPPSDGPKPADSSKPAGDGVKATLSGGCVLAAPAQPANDLSILVLLTLLAFVVRRRP